MFQNTERIQLFTQFYIFYIHILIVNFIIDRQVSVLGKMCLHGGWFTMVPDSESVDKTLPSSTMMSAHEKRRNRIIIRNCKHDPSKRVNVCMCVYGVWCMCIVHGTVDKHIYMWIGQLFLDFGPTITIKTNEIFSFSKTLTNNIINFSTILIITFRNYRMRDNSLESGW